MFTSDQWTMTNFGPVQVEQLADKPHIAVAYDGDQGTNLRGYTVRGVEQYVTIEAQGHEISLGVHHPIYVDVPLALPAGMVKKGQEIEIHPMQCIEWKGTGGTDEDGAMLGEIMSRYGNTYRPEDVAAAQRYMIQNHQVMFLDKETQWLLDCWHDPSRIERMSSAFYKGFLRTSVLDHVKQEDVFYVDNRAGHLIASQILRMLLRVGVVAFAMGERIVIPSYSLRQLIMTVGFGSQGIYLLPEVDSVSTPNKHTVVVDAVIRSLRALPLYGTSGIHAGSLTEINSFLVATEGL